MITLQVVNAQTERPDAATIHSLLSSMVKAVEVSANGKIGRISATGVSQLSCPGGHACDPYRCTFLCAGCYAEGGMQGIHTRALNTAIPLVQAWATAEDLATAEALALDGLTGKRVCRLHVVGDCKTPKAARILSEAAARYTAKHGKKVYTYTHGWRQVSRDNWGGVSVLASCDAQSELVQADAQGYGCALVVDHHEDSKLVPLADGFQGIPCPEQVGTKSDCLSCGLCMRADWLKSKKLVILLAAHGQGVKTVKESLKAKRQADIDAWEAVAGD